MFLLSDYLREWLELRSCGLAARTVTDYRALIVRYIDPLGAVALDALEPSQVQRLLASICAKGHSRTAQAVYVLLRCALAEAVRSGLLASNPVDRVLRPRHRRADPRYWSPQEAAKLLAACPSLRWGHVWALALLCGLRRGELAGLRWADVDQAAGVLHIRNQRQRAKGCGVIDVPPKSAAGTRDLPIPPALLPLLKAEYRRQLSARMRSRRPPGYVVANLDNSPIEPSRLDRQLAADIAAVGLRPINLHGLRHTMATAAVSADVQMRVLQALLGHASMTTTADYYAHVLPSAKSAAVLELSGVYAAV